MATYSPSWVCSNCAHFNADDPPTCRAFPKGILWLILSGQDNHRNPLRGDHGIQFERRKVGDEP